eukprot:g7311.t1
MWPRANYRLGWFGWLRSSPTAASGAAANPIDGDGEEEDDHEFPKAEFLTYRGAADVFLYDDHFALVLPYTPIDIKAWVPLTALTWKRVSIVWRTEPVQNIDKPRQIVTDSEVPTTLPQPEQRAISNAPPESTFSGELEAGVPAFSPPKEKPPVAGDDGYPEVVSTTEEIQTGDNEIAVEDQAAAAAAPDPCVDAGGGNGILLAPASDGGLVARGDSNDVLVGNASRAGGSLPLVHGGREHLANKATASRGRSGGCDLVDDFLAPPEGRFYGCFDSADDDAAPSSSDKRKIRHTVVSSSEMVQQRQQALHRSVPLRLAAAEAMKSDVSKAAVGEKTERRGRQSDEGVATDHTAGAAGVRRMSEKRNVAVRLDPSHHSQLRMLRLRTKPPAGWECEPEGLCLKRQAARKLHGGETAAARWCEPQTGTTTST